MTVTADLTGPEVFFPTQSNMPRARSRYASASVSAGLPPLNQDVETAAKELKTWQAIFEKDVAMMERSDIIIANLTPFGGASADASTLIEVGGFSAGASRSSAIRTPVRILNPACADNWAMTMPS